jgi:hypothetical protein
MCAVIGNASSPLSGLANFFQSASQGCSDVSYTDFIASLKNTDAAPQNNMRQVLIRAFDEIIASFSLYIFL